MKDILTKFIKFGMSGGISALLNLLLLYTIHNVFGIWYLYSSVIAFVISSLINFTLQKIWVFENNDKNKLKKQILQFYSLAGLNILINTLMMYVFVDLIGLNYIFSQILILGFLALVNYFFYQKHIFRNEK